MVQICQGCLSITVEIQVNDLEHVEWMISQLLFAQRLAQPKLTAKVFAWVGQRILRSKS